MVSKYENTDYSACRISEQQTKMNQTSHICMKLYIGTNNNNNDDDDNDDD